MEATEPNSAIFFKDCLLPLLCALFGFISALVGALIGGKFTLRGVKESHKLDLERLHRKEMALVKSFQQMIRTEIETLWNRYQETMGQVIESLPEGQPLLHVFPISQDYFTVYNNNTTLLGKVEDEELRRLIVAVYTRAKGLLDSFKMNNEMVRNYAQTEFYKKHYQDQIYPILAEEQLTGLKQYAAAIKQGHNEIRGLIQKLINRLT